MLIPQNIPNTSNKSTITRTSVFGWRTFPDMWPFVGKESAVGQPTRPTQPSILSGSVDMDYEGGDH